MRQAARRGARYRGPRRGPSGARRRYLQYALTLAIFLAIAVLGSYFGLIETHRPQGRAVVNDGDTLTLAGERIRLRGIDAPEFGQTCRRGGRDYDCGREASRALRALVDGRQVVCQGWERDQYDRLLATCRADGVDIGGRLVETGWAVSYGGYIAEEASARRDAAGIWAGEFERPRAWRERRGGMADREHDLWSSVLGWWRSLTGN